MSEIKTSLIRWSPLAAGALLAAGVSFAAIKSDAVTKTAVGNDVSGRELRALTIESFDTDYSGGGYGWEVVTDKDVNPNGPYEAYASSLQAEREVKLIPGSPRDIKEVQGDANAKVLAVKFAFSFPGNNVISIRPPKVDHYMLERPRPYLNDQAATANYRPRSCFKAAPETNARTSARAQAVDCVLGVEMPGKVHEISIWVMGRGNDYDLEGWIEDWKGETHILKFGSVDFVGWRPLSVKIPLDIPQSVDSFPQVKTMIFKQFKIRSKAHTSLETVYIFMDELRILTDVFEVHFDGAQIDFDRNDCERKEHLLEVMRKNARNPALFGEKADCSKSPGPAAAGSGGTKQPAGGGGTQPAKQPGQP
ncbi:MAG: endoflagellar filament sheath protein [Spirochaetia bacterium]|nr:endoflagellar filament sheath protein [Spirochaetia bacterium]